MKRLALLLYFFSTIIPSNAQSKFEGRMKFQSYSLDKDSNKIIKNFIDTIKCVFANDTCHTSFSAISDFKNSKGEFTIFHYGDEITKESKSFFPTFDKIIPEKTITGESKKILGFNCQKIIYLYSNIKIEAWVTKEIKISKNDYPTLELITYDGFILEKLLIPLDGNEIMFEKMIYFEELIIEYFQDKYLYDF